MEHLYDNALTLLKGLISIPSFSKEEDGTAAYIRQWLEQNGIACERIGNNIIARNRYFDQSKPVVLLNSHHDTVKPAAGYTHDPFDPFERDGKLFGLGSNDAGGALVALMAAFSFFYNEDGLPFNLIMAATAEEEISGANGLSSVMEYLGTVDAAIVGEPTLMQMAVAERGLLVVDALSSGVSGHAARNEGVNAVYKAMEDIDTIRRIEFERVSPFLGPVSMNVTSVFTENKAHNVVPDTCRFTIDVRLNELYSHEEVMKILEQSLDASLTPRSMRLRSSVIPSDHPLVVSGAKLGLSSYGSPTLSDKALMPFPALKLGPGDSARSHTANEFIYLNEIEEGIRIYIDLLRGLSF